MSTKKLLNYTLEKNYSKAQEVLEEHIKNGINHAIENLSDK